MNQLEYVFMTPAQVERFWRYREQLFAAIRGQVEGGGAGGWKSYEGEIELHTRVANFFEEEDDGNLGATVEMKVHCYVYGPHRHYEYRGRSWDEVLQKAELDFKSWGEHEEKMERFMAGLKESNDG